MCGIFGSICRDVSISPNTDYSPIFDTLYPRGPDGHGYWQDEHAFFGHTRLAIVDLNDRAKQPMSSANGRYTITFNGEIYNHHEIREILQDFGYKFLTKCDTEVVLYSYIHWGKGCVHHFRGMFAFAVWDAQEEQLFCARDRFGERPFYYYSDGHSFSFASQVSALRQLMPHPPTLDATQIYCYLCYQFVPEPNTIYREIFKLPPGHTLSLRIDSWQIELESWFDVEKAAGTYEVEIPSDMDDILACIRDSLEESVKLCLRADVPVALALSGGIDSGAIAAFAQKHSSEPLHAFTVGYPGRPHYDEREQAISLAKKLGLVCHEVEIPTSDFVDFFPQLVKIMDEPIADIAAFGHLAVPAAAHKMGIKVLLTGIGGDELFWGYDESRNLVHRLRNTHNMFASIDIRRIMEFPLLERFLRRVFNTHKLPFAQLRKSIHNWFLQGPLISAWGAGHPAYYEGDPDFTWAYKRLSGGLGGLAFQAISHKDMFQSHNIGMRAEEEMPGAIIAILCKTWLVSNCLALSDKLGMGVSVETRLPFLDAKLVSLIMAIRNRIPDWQLGQKALLRAALKDVLPAEVLSREKSGFQPPVVDWMRGVVQQYGEIVLAGQLVRTGMILKQVYARLLGRLANCGHEDLFLLYKIVLLEIFIANHSEQAII